MRKKLLYYFTLLIAIILLPNNVFAENVTVKARDGGPVEGATVIATFEAEKEVTTIAELKQKLENDYNVNLSDYLFINGIYEEATDSAVICKDDGYECYQDNAEWIYYFDLAPIDHTEKKINLNSVPATNEGVLFGYTQIYYDDFETYGMFTTCNNTYTKCTFLNQGTFKAFDNVVIAYNYNEEIYNVAKKVIDSGLLNKDTFHPTDTELLHFINYGGSLADYTSEFKNLIDNKNFDFEWDQRAGGNEPLEFETAGIGFFKFLYKGVLCYVKERVDVIAEHVIYVPNDTTDILQSIKDRLNEMFGENLHLSVTKSTKTINEALDDVGYDHLESGGDEYFYIINKLNATVEEGNTFYFKAVKDSSKINNNISFKSNDLVTNVGVSTDENIPVDTKVSVTKLTSGDTYNKIIKALSIEDAEMFDITLHSNGQDKNITQLENGKFKVRIPIPQKYEGKTLTVYYVDDNNETTEYQVLVKDGYAEFETDHFSVYTLTEKEEIPEPIFKLTYNFNGGNRQGELEYIDESVAVGIEVNKANFIDTLGVTAPEGKELDAIEINGTRYELGSDYLLNKDTTFKYIWKDALNEETLPDEKEEKTDSKGETVPKTFDNINSYIIMLVISAIILIGTIIVITRKKLIKNK